MTDAKMVVSFVLKASKFCLIAYGFLNSKQAFIASSIFNENRIPRATRKIFMLNLKISTNQA
jgi:hypothetical protein